ncbi:MAG: hypothetical protein JST65_22500 [Acidobacteria bacterium]|nr:hypothetical protein [Acidobacteriota bacterium]
MKYCAPVLITLACLTQAVVVPAQDFLQGQAARVVLGQPTFTSQDPGASDRLLGGAGGVAFANGMLFVADANKIAAIPQNHRVLIYKDIKRAFPAATDEISLDETNRCPVCTGRPNLSYGAADVVLGQATFATTDLGRTRSALRLPTQVASNGQILVVADTENNRVLIWRTIPSSNNAPADVVLGAPDFTSIRAGVLDNKSFRGPQGVWIQGNRLFVADTQNHRVMVWNNIPTANDTPADYVLGQKDFLTTSERDILQSPVAPVANRLRNPVSVTSDGKRLFVADLGYNRVLIWNSIPTATETPADVVLGQPDMTSELSNNSSALCDSNGTDADGKATYPVRCGRTMDFPRFALSDGKRLFVADGGNDRILVWNTIPTENAKMPDLVIGQPDFEKNIVTDTQDFFTPNLLRGAPNTTRTPTSLAWDGENLYVATPYDRRVMVFTAARPDVKQDGVRNAFSRNVYAIGVMEFGGTITADNELTVQIGGENGPKYVYKVVTGDTIATIVTKVAALINDGQGDPLVIAQAVPVVNAIILTARQPGETGNAITVTPTLSENATLTATGGTPTGGGDATRVAPGGLIVIQGQNLSDGSAQAPEGAQFLPRELAGVQVYIDGIRVPLLTVSPTEIQAQVPWSVFDANSSSLYVRTKRNDGTITTTTAVNLPVALQNPGILAESGEDPRPGLIYHSSSAATGTVLIDGSPVKGDVVTVTIEDRAYTYTTVDGDTVSSIRDNLIGQINGNADEKVYAEPVPQFSRIRLRAKVEGPEGNRIVIAASNSESSGTIMNVSRGTLCCSNVAGARVTAENPAEPGEQIILYATGLGIVSPDVARENAVTGVAYDNTELNTPVEFVSSLAGGRTANVIKAALKPGLVGVYEVILELNSDMPTNPRTQVTISQYLYTSNIVTFPVVRQN